MTTDQDGPAPEGKQIAASGTLEDGIITIRIATGSAEVTLRWEADDDEDDIDTLIRSIHEASERVLKALIREQAARG